MAKKKSKKDKNIIDDTDYIHRQQLFDLLSKLGLKSIPSWFFGDDVFTAALNNYGQPDMLMMDPETFKAYKKAFGGKRKK